MKNRRATIDNTIVAQGYSLNDLTANYTKRRFEVGLEVQNLFNTSWKDAQYEVESQLKGEAQPVDDMSFTPGMPFFLKLKFSVFFKIHFGVTPYGGPYRRSLALRFL